MSSDGSVSSRISQFGLYRSIDARTEEFLKLSKKRQIKQGCVCAAISTALTVTVVVTVLLIYEYNVIAEARRTSNKANWLDLMNNSADDPNLLERINKEKIEIDRNTLKLLPILLKALNQNRYVEKNIEEPASLYPPYKDEGTTETTLTKNIFADARNWIKTPYSRLYTIEYKTSPIVYFKSPTRNTEYFTKIRKIRDYQRILNYVDKMISDKSSLGTTHPMKRDNGHTEKPYKMTTPLRKLKLTQNVVNKQKTSPKPMKNEKTTYCKCSHKLSEIMKNLLSSIQQLLAYFSGSSPKEADRCNNNKNNTVLQAKPLKSLDEKSKTRNLNEFSTEENNILQPKLPRISPYRSFLDRHKYVIDYTPTKSLDERRDHTINTIMSLIKPNFKKNINNIGINFESNEAFSTTNSYTKYLDKNDILKVPNSKSYPKYLDQANLKAHPDVVTTVADYILQQDTYDVTPNIRSSLSTFSETDYNDDEFGETTEKTTNLAVNFHSLDPYSLELVKRNLLSRNKNHTTDGSSYPFKGARKNQTSYTSIASMRKMGNLVSNDKDNSRLSLKLHRFTPISKSTTIKTTLRPNYERNSTHTTKKTQKPRIVKNKTKTININNKDTHPEQNRSNDIMSEEVEKIRRENNSNETTLQHLEEAIMILNNETKNEVQNYDDILGDTYHWKMVRLEETTSAKSMMPLSRSTYLEMQRNDWKQDENHDFDNDMNNYFE